MHPTLDAIKSEFDKIEATLVDKLSRGHVADWPEYREVVGRIKEVRDGRERTLESVKKILEEA